MSIMDAALQADMEQEEIQGDIERARRGDAKAARRWYERVLKERTCQYQRLREVEVELEAVRELINVAEQAQVAEVMLSHLRSASPAGGEW